MACRATVSSDGGATENAIARRRYNRRSSSRPYLGIPLNASCARPSSREEEPEERRSISTPSGTPPPWPETEGAILGQAGATQSYKIPS